MENSNATEIHCNHFGLDLQREQWPTVVIVNFSHSITPSCISILGILTFSTAFGMSKLDLIHKQTPPFHWYIQLSQKWVWNLIIQTNPDVHKRPVAFKHNYHIMGNFHKLVKKWFSRRKLSWIARLCCAKGCHTPKFRAENFREQPQNHKIRKGFLPQKFPAIQYLSWLFYTASN